MGSTAAATLLTKDVLTYQESENNGKSIFNEIYLFIYRYPVERGYLQEELASDFLLFLVPKLERIVKRYKYEGISFEGYLRNIIYWQIKTFTHIRKKAQIKEQIYTKFFYNCFEKISFYDREPDSFDDDSVCEREQPYAKHDASPYLSLTKSLKGKKKILVIALIHADTIKKSVVSGVASTCCIPEEQLNTWIQELKDSLDGRYEKVEKLNSKRNSVFFTLLELQTKLKDHTKENDAYHSVTRKISLYQNQLKHLHTDLKRAQGKIHYDSVAEILDIPAGTVASTVFYVRKLSKQYIKTPMQ
ncbi:MAG: hypothetical protein HQ557_04960 [Bacteroidetes bacterium]|nr:hypothetical protein [Bacteroidota bacterium]